MKYFSFRPFIIGFVAVSLACLITSHFGRNAPPNEPAIERSPRRHPTAIIQTGKDAEQAFRAQLSEAKNSYRAYQAAMQTAAEIPPTRFESIFATTEDSGESSQLRQIWSQLDPASAMRHFDAMSREDNNRAGQMSEVLEIWASNDIDAATAWLREFTRPENLEQDVFQLFHNLKVSLVEGAAKADPDRAIALMHELNINGARLI